MTYDSENINLMEYEPFLKFQPDDIMMEYIMMLVLEHLEHDVKKRRDISQRHLKELHNSSYNNGTDDSRLSQIKYELFLGNINAQAYDGPNFFCRLFSGLRGAVYILSILILFIYRYYTSTRDKYYINFIYV